MLRKPVGKTFGATVDLWSIGVGPVFKFSILGKGSKKNCEKAVRLTTWVDPPPPPPKRSGKCEKKLISAFDFGLWLSMI